MNSTVGIKKITDFTDKSLLLVDDDNPFRERLASLSLNGLSSSTRSSDLSVKSVIFFIPTVEFITVIWR